MITVKQITGQLTSNLVGTVVGAGVGFYAAKKFAHVSNKWGLGLCAIVGAVVGAGIEYKIKARNVKPVAAAKK